MEQRPVRRRRRRRRSGTVQRETIAWLTLFVSLVRRGVRWGGLLLLVAAILLLGLGAPMTPFDKILSFWGHW